MTWDQVGTKGPCPEYGKDMKTIESQGIEYKLVWRDDCLKAVSAFANSRGGMLIVGIDDKGEPAGLKNVKKLLEDIPNTIRNKLGIIPSVEPDKENQKDIIKITVSSSSVPISYNGKFYQRSGSTVQELRGKDLTDFLLQKTGNSWDAEYEDQTDWENLEESTIEDFRRYAADRIPSIIQESDIKTILQKLNLIEKQKLKRSATLLFGKDTHRLYSHACVKIGRFLTDTDIQTTDIVSGNLFSQLETTLEILRTKYLISNIKYEGIHRRDILEYPYEALREAIINALIHRDYRSFAQTQIRVYPDKLVIMNAGGLPPEVPVESLKTNHLSKPRNKLLADVFYYAGFIEAWGHGTLKIVEKCLEQGMPEPDFKAESSVMTVTFYKDKWNEETLKKLGLNERQMKAINYIKTNKMITVSSYKTLIRGVSEKTLYRDLQYLVAKNILKEIGEKKGRKYELS